MKWTWQPKYKFLKVRADALAIHPVAQRDLAPSLVNRIKKALKPGAIGVIHAVEYVRDGMSRLMVVDGQHRITALLAVGMGDLLVDVKVHLDVQDDAAASELFLLLNTKKDPSPWDKWRNEITAQDAVACNARAIALKHRLDVKKGKGNSALCCITTIKKIYVLDSGKTLDAALSIITEAWGTSQESLEGRVLGGVALFLHRYPEANIPLLARKLSKYRGGPSSLLGNARGRHDRRVHQNIDRCVAECIRDCYNVGMRSSGTLAPF